MRIKPLEHEELDDLQLRIVADIERGPRGRAGDLMRLWLHSPYLADHVQKVGGYFRDGTPVPRRVVEMVILIVAYHWRCDVEWYVHAPIAAKQGLDATVIEAIRRGKKPSLDDAALECVYDFTSALLETRSAPGEAVDRLIAVYGKAGFIDISILIGHYIHGAIVINASGLRPPEDKGSQFDT